MLALLSTAALADRTTANVDCRSTGTDFVYDCSIRLKPARTGVKLVVGADMPSMPKAHYVKPVVAKQGKPGDYTARLDLEMPGEWELDLRLSGAVRQRILVRYEFKESGSAPRK